MPDDAMTPRERMLAAIHHQPVDRIPTDIWATGEVREQLRARFGPGEAYREALHIDGMVGVGPAWAGPPQPDPPPGETVNYWGMRHRRIDYGAGAYDEQIHYPLAEARTIADLDAYAWPQADWFDFSDVGRQAAEARQRHVCSAGYMAIFFYHNLLRGLDVSLMDPHDDPEFTHALLDRIGGFFLDYHRRMFEAADGGIDITQVTDDLGTQTGPMISLDTWRAFYKPWKEKFIALAREFDVLVMHHDDGAIRPFLPDLADMGVHVLNPIQWTCPGMELEGLKRDFGDRFCFHGAIDNQDVLPHGTPDDVRREVRRCIDILASDGTGYVVAPCHNIQPVTPIENIIAMYDEAHHYGRMARVG